MFFIPENCRYFPLALNGNVETVFFLIDVKPSKPPFSPFRALTSLWVESLLSGMRPYPFSFYVGRDIEKKSYRITSHHLHEFISSGVFLPTLKRSCTTTEVLPYQRQRHFSAIIKRTPDEGPLIDHQDCRGSGNNRITLMGFNLGKTSLCLVKYL